MSSVEIAGVWVEIPAPEPYLETREIFFGPETDDDSYLQWRHHNFLFG